MSQVRQLHEEAMGIFDEAILADMGGDMATAAKRRLAAFEKEREAASLLMDRYEVEPTRSILLKGAAIIASQLGLHREAERLLAAALAGNPPDGVAYEVRELLDRHLSHHAEETRALQRASGRAGEQVPPGERVSVVGELVSASMPPGRSGRIRIMGRDGVRHSLVVPKSRMASVVCPYWEHLVKATGRRRGRSIVLDEISAVSPETG